MSEKKTVTKETTTEIKQKKISAVRISGIKAQGVLFRYNGKTNNLKFRFVPENIWNGNEIQEFYEDDFEKFKKPSFYKDNLGE